MNFLLVGNLSVLSDFNVVSNLKSLLGDINNGGAIGSVIGGMLGHSNSNATGGTKRVCQIETRYTEKSMRIYSHSKITFEYMGKTYTLQFEK